jgi:hypothetical protein
MDADRPTISHFYAPSQLQIIHDLDADSTMDRDKDVTYYEASSISIFIAPTMFINAMNIFLFSSLR